MAEVISELGPAFVGAYEGLIQSLPIWAQNFLNLFIWSLLMVIYAIFIWKFYRWIAKKDVLELNLARFNRSEHIVISRVLGGAIYFVEYLVILPLVVFLWFGVFTIFLMFLTKGLQLSLVLVIAAVIVAAIRMTSYYKEDLSIELAKTIPFTLLAVAVTQEIFDFGGVLVQISFLPGFFSEIWIYLIFLVIVEFLLRVLDIIFVAFGLYDDKEVKERD